MASPKRLLSERPTEVLPIPAAITVVLARMLSGDAELAEAIVVLGLSVAPAVITFINVWLKGKRST